MELATDVRTALEFAEDLGGFEAIILDLGLPDGSGLDVARRLRTTGSAIPILVLTARDTVADRVMGLDAGADDYLVKPFAYEELAARLRALARRADGTVAVRAGNLLTSGSITLDDVRRRVTVGRPGDRAEPARVLAPRVLPASSRRGAHPRPAARPRLAVGRGGDPQRGRRLRPLPARRSWVRPARGSGPCAGSATGSRTRRDGREQRRRATPRRGPPPARPVDRRDRPRRPHRPRGHPDPGGRRLARVQRHGPAPGAGRPDHRRRCATDPAGATRSAAPRSASPSAVGAPGPSPSSSRRAARSSGRRTSTCRRSCPTRRRSWPSARAARPTSGPRAPAGRRSGSSARRSRARARPTWSRWPRTSPPSARP